MSDGGFLQCGLMSPHRNHPQIGSLTASPAPVASAANGPSAATATAAGGGSAPLDRAPRGSLRATAAAIAGDIKLAHSVFALPFALLGAFMARAGLPVSADAGVAGEVEVASSLPGLADTGDWTAFAGQLLLIVACMVTARTVAMVANRLLDRSVDARNPRTAGRALPSGRVSPRAMMAAAAIGTVLFILCCAGFGLIYGNWWPVALAGPVLLWISLYPLTKRFTALCHVYLGSALAISPIAAAIAIDPAALGAQPALWLISLNVLCWVAGFDVVYALQDVEVDRREGLHSLPGRLGGVQAMRIARLLHVISLGALMTAWLLDPRLGWLFATGVGATAVLLVIEHLAVIDRSAPATATAAEGKATTGGADRGRGTLRDVRPSPVRVQLAFFTLNGLISCLLGGLGIISLLVASA